VPDGISSDRAGGVILTALRRQDLPCPSEDVSSVSVSSVSVSSVAARFMDPTPSGKLAA
jgi:hypothetical protein